MKEKTEGWKGGEGGGKYSVTVNREIRPWNGGTVWRGGVGGPLTFDVTARDLRLSFLVPNPVFLPSWQRMEAA